MTNEGDEQGGGQGESSGAGTPGAGQGAQDQGGSGGEESSAGSRVDGASGAGTGGEHRPSRLDKRLSQLINRIDAIERAVQERSQSRSDDRQGGDQRDTAGRGERGQRRDGTHEILNRLVEDRLEERRIDEQKAQARELVQAQQGFDPDVDVGMMERIAEENGWDVLAEKHPLKAAKLIVREWQKRKGIAGDGDPARRSQAEGVRGASPQGSRSANFDDLNRRAREIEATYKKDPASARKALETLYRDAERAGLK